MGKERGSTRGVLQNVYKDEKGGNMKRSKLMALLLALIMIVTTIDGAVFAAPECMTEEALKADFKAAADGHFKTVGKKDGVYIGSYDEDTGKVTVAILDGTKKISEVTGQVCSSDLKIFTTIII